MRICKLKKVSKTRNATGTLNWEHYFIPGVGEFRATIVNFNQIKFQSVRRPRG